MHAEVRGRGLALDVLREADLQPRGPRDVDSAADVHHPVEAGVAVDVRDQAGGGVRLTDEAQPPRGTPFEREERLDPEGLVLDAAHGPAVLDHGPAADEEVERRGEAPGARDLQPDAHSVPGEGSGPRGQREPRLDRRGPALAAAVVEPPAALRLEVAEARARFVVPGEGPAVRREAFHPEP